SDNNMPTVQFQCGGCGKLMAVDAQHVGKQVRCPHCQAVVLAPAAPAPQPMNPAQPPSSLTNAPSAQEPDSIFAPAATDDLFGEGPAPRLELPPTAPAEPLNPFADGFTSSASSVPTAPAQ